VGNPGKVGHSKGRILPETALITQGFGAGKSDIARLSDAQKPPLLAEAFPDLANDRTKAVPLNRRLLQSTFYKLQHVSSDSTHSIWTCWNMSWIPYMFFSSFLALSLGNRGLIYSYILRLQPLAVPKAQMKNFLFVKFFLKNSEDLSLFCTNSDET
jgi:hypothetical protein